MEDREAVSGMNDLVQTVSKFVAFSKDGILILDESGSLIEWNPAMEQLTGLLRSEVMGKKVWDIQYSLLPDARKGTSTYDHFRQVVQSILETGRSHALERTHEHEIRHTDATVRTVESFLFAIPTSKGFMISGILRDITDRKRADRALREANRKLNLMGSITRHDINNQLTILSGYHMLLETGSPGLPPAEIFSILNRATTKIQKILAFTKEYQDVGVKSPKWQPVYEMISSIRSVFDTAQVTISIEPACRDIEIFADPMLVKVFYNLIDNSLRHGVHVSEIRFSCARKNDHLCLIYEDNGAGIPDTIRPVLFERGKGKNTGYGMFLVREILAITGFTIVEKGEAGKGARFEIVIPGGSFRVVDTGGSTPPIRE